MSGVGGPDWKNAATFESLRPMLTDKSVAL